MLKAAVLVMAGVLLLLAGCKGAKPEVIEMPSQKMAVVYTKGDPSIVASRAAQALYASVSALIPELKGKGIDFQPGVLRARWPDANTLPKDQWTGIWGLVIPDAVDSIPQKVPGIEVKVETWHYGSVAQILHIGPYATEPVTIKRLVGFIHKKGYEIAGSHEEEYLTPPGASEQKTIIRYPVRKRR